MNLQQLCATLQACLSPNKVEREAAETYLKQHEAVKGHVVNLLRVAGEDSVDPAIRQSASISFKNTAKRTWSPSDDKQPTLDDEDKQLIRDNLVSALVRCPHAVQVQLGEVLRTIVLVDFPERFPSLASTVFSLLTSGDETQIFGGLYALRILARKFEFADEEDRAPLAAMQPTLMPVLLQLLQQLLANPSPDVRMAEYLKLLYKIVWCMSFMGPPAAWMQQDTADAWMGALHAAVLKPAPQEGAPTDADALERWSWWKAKKWALKLAYRLVDKYGDLRMTEGSKHAFAQMFVARWLSPFLDAVLQQVSDMASGRRVALRCQNLCLQLLRSGVETKEGYRHLAPHMDGLLSRVIFPMLRFNAADAQLWAEDPLEFMRKESDLLEDLYSPRTAASNFLFSTCERHAKAHLDRVMAALLAVMSTHTAAVAAGAQVSWEQATAMDGALLAVSTLSHVLKAKKRYRTQVPAMLGAHVLPCLHSPYGFIRAKALWVLGDYCDVEFTDGLGPGSTFAGLFSAVLSGMHDAEVPVAVKAVGSVRSFVETMEDKELLAPVLPHLLTSIFDLMNKVDNEELAGTLETITEKMGADIRPYAVELMRNLVTIFFKYASAAAGADEDDDSTPAAFAAYSVLRAVVMLLDSVWDSPELVPELTGLLLPLLQRYVDSEGEDMIEDLMEILTYLTSRAPTPLGQQLWSLWPQLQHCLTSFGITYWSDILMPLDNFISRDTPTFLAGQPVDYLSSVYQMVEYSLAGDFHDADVAPAPKLLEVVLLHCRGAVDPWLERYLAIVLKRLHTAEHSALRQSLMGVVANALFYNAPLALAALTRLDAVLPTFSAWFDMINRRTAKHNSSCFRSLHTKKVCVLGLLALLESADASLPPLLSSSLPQVVGGVLTLLEDYKALEEKIAKEEAEAEGEEGSDDDEGEEDEEEEDDEAADEYLENLSKLARKHRAAREGNDSDSDDDDGGGGTFWEEDDDDNVETPIDDVDPFVALSDAVARLQAAHAQRWQRVGEALDPAALARVQAALQHAALVKQKQQQKLAAGEAS